MLTLELTPDLAASVQAVTGVAASRVVGCPVIAGSSRLSSFQLYLGATLVRHVDAFSPSGRALAGILPLS